MLCEREGRRYRSRDTERVRMTEGESDIYIYIEERIKKGREEKRKKKRRRRREEKKK